MGALRYIKKNAVAYLFLLPFVVLFTLFVILPILYALFLSLTNYNMLETPEFVGFTNFKLLFLDDDEFITALKNTIVFSCISGPISFFLSFIMAWVINQVKCRNAFSLAFYAPSITSGVAISVVWLYFFSSDRYGLINHFLQTMGLISDPIKWNLDVRYIMPVIIFISIWMGMGAGFLTFLAGFQTVDREMYEAAAIDGIRNRFQELFYITLPQMKPQLLFGAINAIVGSFGVFDIAVSFAGMPSPNYSAHTLVAHLYDYAFTRFEMGYASAIAVILFFITFALGRIVTRVFASR